MADDATLDWIKNKAAIRDRAGLRRSLRPRPANSHLIDLASNDYLGLARDPRVIDAAAAAATTWGTGATGSRLVTGTTELHEHLEHALAELTGFPSALVFASGYAANLAAVTALTDRDCLVVADGGNHASLVDACRLSRARIDVVDHGDLNAVEQALADRQETRALVVVDAISSIDGDSIALPKWHAIARRHGALFVVDDAHGIGVVGAGRGSLWAAGIAGEPDVVATITLSKSLGAQGGAILASPDIRDHLINAARTFIFDTGLNPPAAGAALRAAQIVADNPELATTVLQRATALAALANVPVTGSAIVPVVVGDAQRAFDLANALQERGVHVGCFRPPSVPPGTARLRMTASATLTASDLGHVQTCFTDLGVACAPSS